MKMTGAISLSGLLLLITIAIQAQSLERKVLAAAGNSVISPLQVDYTLGEIAVETAKVSNTIVLTQGFQQPYYVVIANNNIFPYLIIYPNPTTGNALARFILPSPAKMTISIYNALGQLMSRDEVNYIAGEMQYIINATTWKQGAYFIRFALPDGSFASKPLLKLQ